MIPHEMVVNSKHAISSQVNAGAPSVNKLLRETQDWDQGAEFDTRTGFAKIRRSRVDLGGDLMIGIRNYFIRNHAFWWLFAVLMV